MSLPVVAQGIETREQVAALVRMGCTLGQGRSMSPLFDPERALELVEGRFDNLAYRRLDSYSAAGLHFW